MKRLGWLLLVPLAAWADVRGDYVRQWPLQLDDPDAGAYRVALTGPVYRTVRQATLADLQPLDMAGNPLPSALLPADAPSQAPRLRALPLFALPPVPAGGGELQVIAERDASGAVRRIETRTGQAAREGLPAWLLDASALREPLQAIRLDWPAQQRLQAELRIEGSDDLNTWHLLDPHATLVELDNGSERLRQRRIPLDTRSRYLRITALSPQAPALTAAEAELAPEHRSAPLQWLTLGGRSREGGFEFEMDGRFPISRADVASDGNDAVEWRLQSRDARDGTWITRAGPWLAYRVGAGAGGRSEPQVLATTRDRYWRLVPAAGTTVSTPPRLRLGWQPEALVFVARGQAPYALAAGSTRAFRSDAPLQPLLDGLRRERGPQWQPARAAVGEPARELAGDAALAPVRDWKTWILWGLLVLGALVVGGFALSLLRRSGPSGH
ncbi:DUF3999 domain-containing protein [[Pseudomonas] boreopolis]|uniref:DUF3999 domain-containing protein n=1 Tax=Xanthomonas boreopolis TaxID=86183 RepID=UPI003D4419C6